MAEELTSDEIVSDESTSDELTSDEIISDESTTLFESGPSDPVRLSDGPGAVAVIDIAASPEAIWPFVADIDLSARFSPEFRGAEWVDTDQPVGVGSQFVGTNHNEAFGEFKVPAFVDAYEPGVAFGWRTSDFDNPGARWRFELEPVERTDGSVVTRLRYTMLLGPGPSGLTMAIESMPDKEDRIIFRRVQSQHASMLEVVAGIKELAESAN